MIKRALNFGLLFTFFLSACASTEELVGKEITDLPSENTVIVVGEGGSSGNLFFLAAQTYQREHGGEILEVHNGDEFVEKIKIFVEENGSIEHMEYFGHGNNVGLFVNQEPGVHGGIYAYDPATVKDFLAASIYELPSEIFSNGSIQFNGCNVANGYPEENSLAQSFANHFGATVTAPLGPTEFSLDPEGHTVVTEMRGLGAGSQANVYMMPTYESAAFVSVAPQEELQFPDIYEGQDYSESAFQLLNMGLELDYSQGFLPYQNVTGAEALAFCETAFSTPFESGCDLDTGPDEWIRNLDALKMLADAAGASITATDPVRDGYLRWAISDNLLTENFTDRTWYTRGEMAQLTWNIFQWRNRQLLSGGIL